MKEIEGRIKIAWWPHKANWVWGPRKLHNRVVLQLGPLEIVAGGEPTENYTKKLEKAVIYWRDRALHQKQGTTVIEGNTIKSRG